MKRGAADQSRSLESHRASTEANGLKIAVDVDDPGRGRDDEPFQSYRLMILTAHHPKTADHEDGSEPGDRADRPTAVRWVSRDEVRVERHRDKHQAGQSRSCPADGDEVVMPLIGSIDVSHRHGFSSVYSTWIGILTCLSRPGIRTPPDQLAKTAEYPIISNPT